MELKIRPAKLISLHIYTLVKEQFGGDKKSWDNADTATFKIRAPANDAIIRQVFHQGIYQRQASTHNQVMRQMCDKRMIQHKVPANHQQVR